MKSLYKTQKNLLELLKDNVEDPLTIRELQNILGVSSPSVVFHHIKQLENKGYLKRNPQNPKDYQILTDPDKPIVYLNLYGLAQCGPGGSFLDGNPERRIPISSWLIKFPAKEAFLVEARGDSMIPRINEGDLVIARRSNIAQNKDIVICVFNSEAMIKKFYQHGDQIILQSENELKYPPILTEIDEVRIAGIVKGIIHYS